jgi:glycosyltransferase involved in cell wall biosynthesis
MEKLIIVIPSYNEEEVLPITIKELSEFLQKLIDNKKISQDSFLCFVDDGSKDNTWKIIEKFCKENKFVKGIKFSRNVGHQNALLAGLLSNKDKADIYISIDCDLQDDINAIEQMIDLYKKGNEIVYGVRSNRDVDSFFKRKSAELFYDIQEMLGIKIIKNHADYRLISNKVLNHLSKFEERNLYLRAIFPLIGFPSSIVYYERKKRKAGVSKYPLLKMLSLAWDGITSFSTVPLKLITIAGIFIFVISLIMSMWVLYIKIFTNNALPGWASTTLPIYFIGGIQLLSIGIIGEYIGKIYIETKRRPRFIIEKNTENFN